MYIVNQVDTTRQLVRTETCAYVLNYIVFLEKAIINLGVLFFP